MKILKLSLLKRPIQAFRVLKCRKVFLLDFLKVVCVMSIKDFKISAVDSSKGLSIGEYKDAADEILAKADGKCGMSYNCSGGGGE